MDSSAPSTPNRPPTTIARFSDKAQVYANRWDYAPVAFDTIIEVAGLSPQATVADMGAGPGTVSRHFLGRVKQIWAVEPSPEMVAIARETLAHEPSFQQIIGPAEATTLPDQAVDLIAVGRAIHWFDAQPARQEFRRILKPGGWLAILRVVHLDEDLLAETQSLRNEAYGWTVHADKWHRPQIPLSFYFGSDHYQTYDFPDTIEETWPEFIGRLTSFSPAPSPGQPLYEMYEAAARVIFERHRSAGRLTINIATRLSLGPVKMA